MNRAFWIILIPATAVVIGYVVVLRAIGIVPGYRRVAVALAVFVALVWWVARRGKKKAAAAGN
jgi:uncharacterized membrane protein